MSFMFVGKTRRCLVCYIKYLRSFLCVYLTTKNYSLYKQMIFNRNAHTANKVKKQDYILTFTRII